MPDRSKIESTVVGRWIETVNAGKVSMGAVLASGADIGLGDVSLDGLAGRPTVPGDRASVIAPAGSRNTDKVMDTVQGGDVMLVVAPGGATGRETVEVVGGEQGGEGQGAYAIDTVEFFPVGSTWDKTESFSPGGGSADKTGPALTRDIERWVYPGGAGAADKTSAVKVSEENSPNHDTVVVFTDGRSPEEVFGTLPEDAAVSPVDAGETFEAATTVVATPGGVAFDDDRTATYLRAAFEEGTPAPLHGVTFGMGVLSTPDAEAVGRSVNPLASTSTEELLKHDEARQMLKRTGITDADSVEWIDGPVPIEDLEPVDYTLLGNDTDAGMESFVGTVTGDEGPWHVGVHVVRATVDDHVVAVGAHHWPAGSGARDASEIRSRALERHSVPLTRARSLLAEAVSRLEER